jgi:hypothetical protein
MGTMRRKFELKTEELLVTGDWVKFNDEHHSLNCSYITSQPSG